MTTTYYHGSCLVDLPVGRLLLPGSKAGRHANPRLRAESLVEPMDDGVVRHDSDVLWLCSDIEEASGWAINPMMKMTGDDVFQMQEERGTPVACIVYEVKPVGPVFRRLDPHSTTEYGCDKAKIVARHVVEVYDWREFSWEKRDDGWADSFSDFTVTITETPDALNEFKWACSCGGSGSASDEYHAALIWRDHLAKRHPE